MKHRTYITLFILFVFVPFAKAQNSFTKEQPSLVVNILVDGIQTEHIATLWSYFDDGGIKQLFANGVLFPSVQFDYYTGGRPADLASYATGTTPSHHGIMGSEFFREKTREVVSVAQDNRYEGIGTQDGASPFNLLSSTVSDELKLTNKGASRVYAISLDAEDAVLLGGHAADAAVWIDNRTGHLASSTYYPNGLPKWCHARNNDGLVDHLLDFTWEPLYSSFTYKFASFFRPDSKMFSHKASKYNDPQKAVEAFKHTPNANKLVRRLALDAIQQEQLGQRATTDYLSITFTLNPPIDNAPELITSEKEDIYLRLDKEIAILLDSINKMVGLDKTLIILTGNQSVNNHPATLQQQKINTGSFNASRAMALLNNYLMLTNGQGDWVIGYRNKNIYLNERLAEKRKIDFRLISYQTQRFMTEFQGVEAAYVVNDFQNTATGSDETTRVKNSIHPKVGGDIYFTLLPGWTEIDNSEKPVGISGRSMVTAPLLFFGYGLQPSTINRTIRYTDIAPTIAHLLHIPLPNACTGQPIPEILK